jgi:CsoR family transcriptional regulator, copper-sensing transcriptional repressor
MKLKNLESKSNLLTRLRRIEGQVRGVQSMIEEERDCQEILQQFTSIRSALQSAQMVFLQEYATNCLVNLDENDPQQREKFIQDLMTMLGKAP